MNPKTRFRWLEPFKPDIAFARDESSRFLPWIIALMVYLAAFTLAASFTLHHTVMATHDAQTASFSIHLPHNTDNIQEVTGKILTQLKETSGVLQAETITTDHMKSLVEPWLGSGDYLNNLPLPTVIEVKLTPNALPDMNALQARIKTIAPSAAIDDHKQWIGQFSRLVQMVEWILIAISLFILSATAFVVIFACKTSLKIHRGTVQLLHRLGAQDDYIARQFQQHAAFLALKGAFVGCGFAASTVLALHLMARRLDSPLFPTFPISPIHGSIFIVLPLLMGLLALISARASVLGTLRRMP